MQLYCVGAKVPRCCIQCGEGDFVCCRMMWWHRGNGGDGIESHMLTLTLDLIMIGEHTARKYDVPTYVLCQKCIYSTAFSDYVLRRGGNCESICTALDFCTHTLFLFFFFFLFACLFSLLYSCAVWTCLCQQRDSKAKKSKQTLVVVI